MNENQIMESLQDISPFSVRVRTPADAEAYRSVRLRALHEQPPAFGSLPEVEPNLSETAARLAESNDRCFFGAFQGEHLIGIIRLSRYSAPNEKHRAYLAGLYVLSPVRCHGCGRALVREALSRAANAPGIRRVNLRRVNLTVVTQQEAAIRLYSVIRLSHLRHRTGDLFERWTVLRRVLDDFGTPLAFVVRLQGGCITKANGIRCWS